MFNDELLGELILQWTEEGEAKFGIVEAKESFGNGYLIRFSGPDNWNENQELGAELLKKVESPTLFMSKN